MNNLKCTQICKVKEQEDKDLHLKEQHLLSLGAAKSLLNQCRGNQLILKLKTLSLKKGKRKQQFKFV